MVQNPLFIKILWCFSKFFFHHKWNDGPLLHITWYIRVAKSLKTKFQVFPVVPYFTQKLELVRNTLWPIVEKNKSRGTKEVLLELTSAGISHLLEESMEIW